MSVFPKKGLPGLLTQNNEGNFFSFSALHFWSHSFELTTSTTSLNFIDLIKFSVSFYLIDIFGNLYLKIKEFFSSSIFGTFTNVKIKKQYHMQHVCPQYN